jgi:hypothetical protein
MPARRPFYLATLAFLFALALARPAHAQPWFGAGEGALEEKYEAGDLDEEDLARLPAMGRRGAAGAHVRAESWLSLIAFTRGLPSGTREVGAMAVVGLALDKIAQGRERQGPPPSPAEDAGAPRASPTPAADPPKLALDTALARSAVRAAWRVSGIEVNDARIDEMIARSRLSAVLPETRIRAMQLITDAEHTSSYVSSAGTIIDTAGSSLTLEARLTWRFDRLLYADDEGSLERLRMEREDARNRIGGRVLDLLFAWQRALLDVASSDAGSRAELEATLRRCQAEISLDVLTGGWFGLQPLVRATRPPPAPPARR